MAVKYLIVKKKIQTKEGPKEKFYAKMYPGPVIEFDKLVEHMASHQSTYSAGTIAGVLKDMLSCIQELLLEGNGVRLGDLGLMRLSLTARGMDKAADVTSSTIDKAVLLVRNTKTWSNAMLTRNVSFQKAEEVVHATGEIDNSGSASGGQDESEGPDII